MDAVSSRTSLQADLIADLFNSHPASQNFPVVPATCYFYHADLGPTNIITVGDGSVIGVLDWESAGYSPKFWIATNRLFLLDSSRLRVPRVDWLGSSFLQARWRKRGFCGELTDMRLRGTLCCLQI
ncbi:conserved hypothetical protein [Histoplasma capsulatum G186AR]|uniref:Aminoglycoside phosphotransferase domain-containing protein n=2 Tax=Ajellomyces capsulatus TaxID=5037 RepID=C0NN65_AJECG|nr:uncharacterized protein HCBG_04192 [Histoplasma capsulatum G186AR]EEH07313.1 conserved hypothetical protein [Histoplasma capsulatum G186AR]KAG5304553.1 hypothetical protein I7I52_02930 [Histoplasma capsulatum]QSS70151.1 hypothetical protein I7I50_11693 [Histoplasma capsulatum G186AR]